VKPFDADRADPFLFEAGDRVRFYPVGDSAGTSSEAEPREER
jgi:allophanate hydrolase subunit 1